MIHLWLAQTTGILSILDEESKVPKDTDKRFTVKVHSVHKTHFRLQVCLIS